ncbi:PhoX family protein [Microbacterium karelineae]|uniref:PhoX family protein n=1 Tax=Microbacterium karelineae TaxID=2654283 RepID=UPI001E4957A8|nr:PhoX family phosphatase [Microbacterium karelineae]
MTDTMPSRAERGRRPLLNLLMSGRTHGKRSPVTCMYKCDNACFHPAPNTSDNGYFRDIAGAALSRRAVLAGGAAAAAAVVIGQAVGGGSTAQAATTAQVLGRGNGAAFGFTPIAPVPADVDAVTVPEGFVWTPIIRWGDPLFDAADAFDPNAQTAAKQERQFGYNNDYLDIIAEPNGKRAVLAANNEYVNAGIMFPPAASEEERLEQLRISKAAHGFSIVELERRHRGEPWNYLVGAPKNRRITADTDMVFDGPAAGSDLLKTVEHPDGMTVNGTFANCAGGTTPWGTIVSGEENFNGYFRANSTPENDRYGLSEGDSRYGWDAVDPRFDARQAGYENEPNRFGWIVEIDPENPDEAPVKHTALGRMKHEGANIHVGPSRHVAAYMGDDERFDYLYKFVSTNAMKPGKGWKARAHNKTLLSEGSLYVAKFEGDSPVSEITGTGALPSDGLFDGTGEWLPLMVDGESAVEGFTTEEVLVHTRLAADAVGATKMDRCEDVEPNPHTGRVYVACTNNSARGVDGNEGATEANPRNTNRDGHVIEITEAGGDVRSTTFGWSIVILAGDPATNPRTYFAGFPADKVSPISCPDNLAFDSAGNLWISTDGQPSSIGYNDGLFLVPLEGAERGHVQQFLAVPRDAETCGPVIHDRDGSVFVAVQHPGEDGTWGAQNSLFPDYVAEGSLDGGAWGGPRPSVIQVTRA